MKTKIMPREIYYDDAMKEYVLYKIFDSPKGEKTITKIPRIKCVNCGATKIEYNDCEYCGT